MTNFTRLETTPDPCAYSPQRFVENRFWLVTVIGTSIALISICENAFLFTVLVSRRNHRNSHSLYLILLAFFDFFMAFAYIPLMSLNVLVDYVLSVTLLRAWFHYMIPTITVSHIAMTASSFLIVAASLERYCVTVQPQFTKAMHRHRAKIAAASIAIGVLTKFTMALEFNVEYNEECAGTMNEYGLSMSNLALNHIYTTFWRIGVRNVCTVLIPFFVLAALNIRIVKAIQKAEFNFLNVQKLSEAKRKARVRAATRTLVFVVFTYLLSNVLNVVITLWEYIDYNSIAYTDFYAYAVDVVSLSTIIAGALRPPIYVCCQSQLRKELLAVIKRLIYGSTYRGFSSTTVTTAEETMANEGEGDENAPSNEYAKLLLRLGAAFVEKHQEEKEEMLNKDTDSPLLVVPSERPAKSVSFVLENEQVSNR